MDGYTRKLYVIKNYSTCQKVQEIKFNRFSPMHMVFLFLIQIFFIFILLLFLLLLLLLPLLPFLCLYLYYLHIHYSSYSKACSTKRAINFNPSAMKSMVHVEIPSHIILRCFQSARSPELSGHYTFIFSIMYRSLYI